MNKLLEDASMQCIEPSKVLEYFSSAYGSVASHYHRRERKLESWRRVLLILMQNYSYEREAFEHGSLCPSFHAADGRFATQILSGWSADRDVLLQLMLLEHETSLSKFGIVCFRQCNALNRP